MRVVLIGAGNTGTVFGRLFQSRGHQVIKVISRSRESAKTLGAELKVDSGILAEDDFGEADLYVVCLPDHAMNSAVNYISLRNKFVVHTAGSLSINIFESVTDKFGVLYPLQTLTRFVDRIPEIPLMVDANNEQTTDALMTFAESLSPLVQRANDTERMGYHIAAVFAANYANHMYTLAEVFCQRENLDFKNMLPLISEIHNRVLRYSPFLTQTGPAIRNDTFTIAKHLNALRPHDDLKYMYLKLAENILKLHGVR